MTAKDLIINFLYLVFFLVLVGSSIVFFSQGARFETFTLFLRSAWPIGFVLFIAAFRLRLIQQERIRADKTGINLFTISVSIGDKMKGELIAFSIPLVVLFIAALGEGGVTGLDIVQAVGAFLIAFLYQKYIWLRAR